MFEQQLFKYFFIIKLFDFDDRYIYIYIYIYNSWAITLLLDSVSVKYKLLILWWLHTNANYEVSSWAAYKKKTHFLRALEAMFSQGGDGDRG